MNGLIPSPRRWRVATDEGFIDNVIARSLHGKRRSNPVKSMFLTGTVLRSQLYMLSN
ncbi:MAG: hypothetical protein LBK53_01830 [Heliobacteriaceae bacterium]|nr:hypothetical protein [Heliobacteriaceae bacterium]